LQRDLCTRQSNTTQSFSFFFAFMHTVGWWAGYDQTGDCFHTADCSSGMDAWKFARARVFERGQAQVPQLMCSRGKLDAEDLDGRVE